MPRSQLLHGTDANRILAQAAGKIMDNEIHWTRDQKRVFVEDQQIRACYLGIVADQTAMLALNTSQSKGCWPMDLCKRTDIGGFFLCISNHGGDAADWLAIGGGIINADDIVFNNAESGLSADNVQDAIDELSVVSVAREPSTNGDPDAPELYFDSNGDVVMQTVTY